MKKLILFGLTLCALLATLNRPGLAKLPEPTPVPPATVKGGLIATGGDPVERTTGSTFSPTAAQANLAGVRVLYDLSHLERTYLDPGDPQTGDSWSLAAWRDALAANGASVDKLLTSPITASSLSAYDVLVISMPTIDFGEDEISAIKNFIASGKGVLFIGEFGMIPYWSSDTIINQITAGYGLSLNPDDLEFMVTTQIANRPGLTDGVITLVESHGASITGGEAVFYNNERTKSLMATAESGGRVALIGDTNIWADNSNWMDSNDNGPLALNTIRWLAASSSTAVNVKVIDESNAPVSGARVYLNDLLVPGTTGSDGAIKVSGVEVGDRLVAANRIFEQSTNKSSHSQDNSQNWAYRVYLTSADIGNDGAVSSYVINSTSISPTLTLKRSNPLVGYNIVASVEWDATDAYLNDLEKGFKSASDYLYDASDGQIFYEQVSIYDDKVNWDNADFQFKASNQEWPHTNNIGGIGSGSDERIYFGRYFSGRSANQGLWAYRNGYRTFIHEFGHYALYLYDEYFYYGGFLNSDKLDAQCTANRANPSSQFSSDATASSLMDSQYTTSEFCSALTANPHNHNTYQHQKNNESTWETIVKKLKDSQEPQRWTFQTPLSRGQVVAGPANMPVAGWTQMNIDRLSAGTCAGTLKYQLQNILGKPAKSVDVWLNKSTGRTIYQGKSDDQGEIEVLGAANGDNFAAQTRFNLYLNATTIDCSSEAAGLAGPDAQAIQWQMAGVTGSVIVLQPAPFGLDVSTIPAAGGGALEVRVSTTATLATAPEVALTQSAASSPAAVSMSFDSAAGRYSGTAVLDPLLGKEGVIKVSAVDATGQSLQSFTNFSVETVSSAQDIDVISGDGDVELHLPAGSLSQDTAISIAPSSSAAPLNNEKLVMVSGPYEIATAAGALLNNPGALTFHYHAGDNEAGNVDLETLKIYRWDAGLSQWIEVGGSLNANHQQVSAAIDSLAIYALFGERGFKINLPLTTR